MRHEGDGGRLAAVTMQGLLYYTAACAFCIVKGSVTWRDALLMLTVFLPLYLFALFREKCEKFFLFLLAHVAISGVFVYLMPGAVRKALAGVCVAAMAVQSFYVRIKPSYEREECPPPAAILLFAAVYLAGVHYGQPTLCRLACYGSFLFLMLFAVHRSQENTAAFLYMNKNMANLPAGQIAGLNKLLLGVFLVFLLMGMLFLQRLPMGDIFGGIGFVLRKILSGILTFLFRLFKWEDSYEMMPEPERDMGGFPIEPEEPSVWAQILDKIFVTVLYIALAVGAVYIIIRLLYGFYKRFYENQKPETDESEFLLQPTPGVARVFAVREKKKRMAETAYDKKIRRLYKRYVRQKLGRGEAVPEPLTPVELEGYIRERQGQRMPEDGNPEEMEMEHIGLYEKARYSEEACTREDVERMKRKLV